MKNLLAIGFCALSLSCGLESFGFNVAHSDFPRPASALRGLAPFAGADTATYFASDSTGTVITPFLTKYDANALTYEMQLPSAKYAWTIAQMRDGNMLLSAIVPALGEESVTPVDFDARTQTETLIVMARLSHDGLKMKTLTPSVYAGTRAAIRNAMAQPGPIQDLLHMVERIIAKFDKDLTGDPAFFIWPVYDGSYNVKTSAIQPGYFARHPNDYDASGNQHSDSDIFDAKLAQAAKAAPSPAGCADPTKIRLVFTVDFNAGSKNGNCGSIDRFKWMFFVGWVHQDSEVQDPAVGTLLGSSTPNTVSMYDDGTNGDEVAGDNIWTVAFDVPRVPGKKLRIGYKYTWGSRGSSWTGTEEWPGNSRILEVVDDNGDSVVYRHDVFGDEATNKDKSNLNLNGNGSITWTTDLHGCGTPETHENGWDDNSCKCMPVLTPKGIGPINRACGP
jgi:hypothetical protein